MLAGLLALELVAVSAGARPPADDSPDARIRYYRQRLGGRSTYPAYARLGLAYAERARAGGRVEDNLEATRLLARSLAMQPNYEALVGLSSASLALHRFPEALRYAREAVATSPGAAAAEEALFDALLGTGERDEARSVLERLPADSFGRLVREAAIHEQRGATADALRALSRACTLPSTVTGSTTTRAWCEVRIGALALATCDESEANARYERALGLVPGHAPAEEHLAELEAASGRTAAAIARYRRLLARTSEPHHRLELAALLEATTHPREAAAERQRAREELRRRADQDVRDAWHELALLDADAPETAANAIAWAEKDWANRHDVHAADALAWARLKAGDAAKAGAGIDTALAPGGGSPLMFLHGAAIRARTGRPDDAGALFARALACPAALTPTERRLAERIRGTLHPRPSGVEQPAPSSAHEEPRRHG